MFLLYIDPGTGSAIFSILIGVAAALYFFSRALLIKVKSVISGGKTSSVSGNLYPFVVYNEGKQYSNVFKPVLDEFESRAVNLLYLTSSADDPLLSKTQSFIKKEFIGEGNKAFSRLNMLNADIVLMTTPGLGVYQLKRSKGVKHYAHVLHMPTDATMYRLFGLDYYDSVLLSGDYQAKDIRRLENQRGLRAKALVTTGCTYLDVYEKKMSNSKEDKKEQFTVLLSPSWGPSALLYKFGEKLITPLLDTGFKIIIRPHPQSKKSESSMLESLKEKYKSNSNLEWDFEPENIISLSRADIMISDFSGIIYDYVFLFNRPVLYSQQGFDIRPYDADDLEDNPAQNLWQFKTLKEIGVEIQQEDFNKIGEIIKCVSSDKIVNAAIKKAKKTAWQHQGESGKRVVDFLLETKKKIDENSN